LNANRDKQRPQPVEEKEEDMFDYLKREAGYVGPALATTETQMLVK
jgi:hypothetical protein